MYLKEKAQTSCGLMTSIFKLSKKCDRSLAVMSKHKYCDCFLKTYSVFLKLSLWRPTKSIEFH